ncbi:ATP-dependent DNA helicase DDX11, partial [Fragariocoptes setiger]
MSLNGSNITCNNDEQDILPPSNTIKPTMLKRWTVRPWNANTDILTTVATAAVRAAGTAVAVSMPVSRELLNDWLFCHPNGRCCGHAADGSHSDTAPSQVFQVDESQTLITNIEQIKHLLLDRAPSEYLFESHDDRRSNVYVAVEINDHWYVCPPTSLLDARACIATKAPRLKFKIFSNDMLACETNTRLLNQLRYSFNVEWFKTQSDIVKHLCDILIESRQIITQSVDTSSSNYDQPPEQFELGFILHGNMLNDAVSPCPKPNNQGDDANRASSLMSEKNYEQVEKKEYTTVTEPKINIVDKDFNFPYDPPYDIQIDLMRCLYSTIDEGKFALLESPTGTGKSLSLICASLTWLRDEQALRRRVLEDEIKDTESRIEKLRKDEQGAHDWLSIQTNIKDITDGIDNLRRELDKLKTQDQTDQTRRTNKLNFIQASVDKRNPTSGSNSVADLSNRSRKNSDLPSEEQDLIVDLHLDPDVTISDDDEEEILEVEYENQKPKIYYASRTHSQLSQMIGEVKRTTFSHIDNVLCVKVVTLASRANMCVNPCVTKLKDSSAINERCMELQREKSAQKRCSYLQRANVHRLKEDILSEVQDIEELARKGRSMGACPYYASRAAVPEAELVVIPYNNLFHPETRAASSLDLKDSVIIVDEAHNLLETICSIHSASIKGSQLIASHQILSRYYARYQSRLSPQNAESIRNIVHCLTTLIKYLRHPTVQVESNADSDDNLSSTKALTKSTVMNVMSFIGNARIESFNIFKIVDYFKHSQLARKLLGFSKMIASNELITLNPAIQATGPKKPSGTKGLLARMTANAENTKKRARPTKKAKLDISTDETKAEEKVVTQLKESDLSLEFMSKDATDFDQVGYPIYQLIEFLRSLTNFVDDGRIIIDVNTKDFSQSAIKFLMVNPSNQMKDMVESARSICLAGGTMQPFSEFLDLLFGPLGVPKSRITMFSCGHVIPRENLFVGALSTGCSGKTFDLSYRNRSQPELINEIGRTVANISMITPGGLVCFFPSYDYEQTCFDTWTKSGIINSIEARSKTIFREPKLSSQLQSVLDEYASCIKSGRDKSRGSLLLSVVGGKMSEGINFNDDLGRCIIMIGMPYANIRSTELQEKMRFYDANSVVPKAGQAYYENLCLRGINQSIGRAIRHKNDYAAIVLLDQRYTNKSSIRSGLPKWIGSSMNDYDTFGKFFAGLRDFYHSKRIIDN